MGWDLLLDLDGLDYAYAKLVAQIILDHLKEIGVHNGSIKFSGNKGFHIAIPFAAFSKNIVGIGETRTLFPEAPRRITSYLVYELRGKIAQALLETVGSIEVIAKKHNLRIAKI